MTRISTDRPDDVNTVPEHMRPFLDACPECHDGDLYTPAETDWGVVRTVANYVCDADHRWNRGFTNP